MWDEPLPSDSDIKEMKELELQYRWNILDDLEASFLDHAQRAWAWVVLAIVGTFVSLFFGWMDEDHEFRNLVLIAIFTIASASIGVHSTYWYYRFKHRRKAVSDRM